MLDRKVIKDFLYCRLEGVKIPRDISFDNLVETFCRYTEEDFYEWLNDNFKSFFNHGNPDWDWIRDRIKDYLS